MFHLEDGCSVPFEDVLDVDVETLTEDQWRAVEQDLAMAQQRGGPWLHITREEVRHTFCCVTKPCLPL